MEKKQLYIKQVDIDNNHLIHQVWTNKKEEKDYKKPTFQEAE